MNDLVEKIANAVLYEGYILYPYRPSSIKNRQRFNFGVITPRSYSEAQRGTESWRMQTQVLLLAKKETTVDVKVRFLQLREREVYPARRSNAAANKPLEVNGKIYQPWQEAVEREVRISNLDVRTLEQENARFVFPANQERETVRSENNEIAAMIFRTQKAVKGDVSVTAEKAGRDLFRITVLVSNSTGFDRSEMKSRDEALAHSLVSAHTILTSDRGEFVSLLEPSAEYQESAAACQNIGTYPVLAGAAGEKTAMLSSPIILYDYPEIAPESPGELFDGTEIDEILTLRILTMTDDEKREMSSVDERARKMLERTETMDPAEFMKLHGVLRRPGALSRT
jgi:hypothetical protein